MTYISRLVTFTATATISDYGLGETEATRIASDIMVSGLAEVAKSGENRFIELTGFEVVRNREISRTEEEDDV